MERGASTTNPDQLQYSWHVVLRPAAVLSESSARLILAGLAERDVKRGGCWEIGVGTWHRYTSPQLTNDDGAGSVLLGTISCVYDRPARLSVTVFQVSLTFEGLRRGWTAELLCDDAFAFAGLTFKNCPRAAPGTPPRPFDPRKRDIGPPRGPTHQPWLPRSLP